MLATNGDITMSDRNNLRDSAQEQAEIEDKPRASRIDIEWGAINAFRELLRVASRGNMSHSTYQSAIEFGGSVYPDLLGEDRSLLRRARESRLTTEYRQKAGAKQQLGEDVTALQLAEEELSEIENLINASEFGEANALRRKKADLLESINELDPPDAIEHTLIFRDVNHADRNLPSIRTEHNFREFKLPDDNVLRITLYHPSVPEHISGADLMYEVHDIKAKTVNVVFIQYKIWHERTMYLSDPRMNAQLEKMREHTCKAGLCKNDTVEYRFPYCASFLRPTDKLQSADQSLRSTGEHLPICRIAECTTLGPKGGAKLEYNGIKKTSLAYDVFEVMFNRKRIGSRALSYTELGEIYEKFQLLRERDRLLIHAQDFTPLLPETGDNESN